MAYSYSRGFWAHIMFTRVGIPRWRSRNAFPECYSERGILGLPRVPVPRSAFRRNSPCAALTEHLRERACGA